MTPALAIACVMLLALTLYAPFGGADYGAGVWDLLARGPRAAAQRDLIAHAIGPVWEANHVWLILVIVLLFTAFPPVFSVVMTSLHVPLSLMLVGIVLRGSAFTFRAYDPSERARNRWSRLFAIPSVITPVMLGAIIGAIATGRIGQSPDQVARLSSWLGVFPLVVGMFTLAIFAFLAAVYLTLETDDRPLQEDFRLRALVMSVLVGALAYTVYLLAMTQAPLVVRGLSSTGWGMAIRYATGIFAIAAIAGLWFRRYAMARIAAMVQVSLILWGCALAQSPYLVPPDLTIENSAAPGAVLRLLLWALAAGAALLFPSLYALVWIFKGHTFARGSSGDKTAKPSP